jgi:hypothetical protein
MAKPNYSYEKRQRELQKKQKKEEKLAQRRAGASKPAPAEGGEPTAAGAEQAPESPAAQPQT